MEDSNDPPSAPKEPIAPALTRADEEPLAPAPAREELPAPEEPPPPPPEAPPPPPPEEPPAPTPIRLLRAGAAVGVVAALVLVITYFLGYLSPNDPEAATPQIIGPQVVPTEVERDIEIDASVDGPPPAIIIPDNVPQPSELLDKYLHDLDAEPK